MSHMSLHWFRFFFSESFCIILFYFGRHLKAFCYPRTVKCFIFKFDFLFRNCFIIESKENFQELVVCCIGILKFGDRMLINKLQYFLLILEESSIYILAFHKCLSVAFVDLCSLRNWKYWKMV